MPPGLLLGLFASLGWGCVDVCGAVASRRIGSLRVLVGSQVASLAALGLIVLADPARLGPDAGAGIAAGIPLGVVSAAAYLAYFTSLRLGPISVVSPVILAYGGTTVLLAVAVRGERLLAMQTAGAVLATAGVVLAGLVLDGRSLRRVRLVGHGVVVAVLTMLLFAIVTVLLAGPIGSYGWLPVIVGSRLSNVSTALLLLAVANRSGWRGFGPLVRPAGSWSRALVALVVVAGVLDMAAFIGYGIGLEIAPTWLVGLSSSFGPLVAIGYAMGQLGERLRPTQWLGVSLILAGVVVLAVAG